MRSAGGLASCVRDSTTEEIRVGMWRWSKFSDLRKPQAARETRGSLRSSVAHIRSLPAVLASPGDRRATCPFRSPTRLTPPQPSALLTALRCSALARWLSTAARPLRGSPPRQRAPVRPTEGSRSVEIISGWGSGRGRPVVGSNEVSTAARPKAERSAQRVRSVEREGASVAVAVQFDSQSPE
jgi:hypothetical protein